ncbi:MAG: hypothetical protein ACYC3X_13170 [Pirellulaceae bacterium]
MKTSLDKKSRTRADQAVAATTRGNAETPEETSVKAASGSLTADGRPASPHEPVVVTSGTALAAHVTWMLYGPFILLLILAKIVSLGTGWLTALDVTYFIVVAGMILCRWLDQRSGQATQATGEPSTWADFKRYAILLLPLAMGAWILANVLGNHWLHGDAGI